MDLDWDQKLIDEQTQPQYAQEPVLEEGYEYDDVDEFIDEDSDMDDSTVNTAIKRIEQAKLYESILKHEFFAPGSARPEIQTKVTKEIRDFILDRLTILMGLKTEPKDIQIKAEMPWNDDQIAALTSIASRLVDKKNSTKTVNNPVVQQFASSEVTQPRVNVATTHNVQPAQPQQKVAPKTRKVRRKRAGPTKTTKNMPAGMTVDPNTGRPMSANGVVLYGGQVQNAKAPPKKMPSQMEMNQMNNSLVQRNATGAGSVGDKLLGMAITQAQNLNRNILED